MVGNPNLTICLKVEKIGQLHDLKADLFYFVYFYSYLTFLFLRFNFYLIGDGLMVIGPKARSELLDLHQDLYE